MRPGTRVGRYSYVSPLPQLGGEWLLQATLNFLKRLSVWEGLGDTVSLRYELRPLSVLSTGLLMPGTGFALEAISLANLSLGLSVAMLHSFLMFSPAFWSDVARRHCLQRVGL